MRERICKDDFIHAANNMCVCIHKRKYTYSNDVASLKHTCSKTVFIGQVRKYDLNFKLTQ